jgi:putative integral membrane protein (TIGR02587 family)
MRSIQKSLQEYARGIAGGLLFSLPLLYTMEVWWTGFLAPPWRLLACVAGTFGLLLGYNHYVGIREDATFADVVVDSVEELGIGFLVAAGVLWLLGRVTLDMPVAEVIGKIVLEAMTVAIGVSVGTAQLGAGEEQDKGRGNGASGAGQGQDQSQDQRRAAGERPGEESVSFGGQVVIALCGAVLFAANVAPTEEIVMIAAEASPWRLIGMVLLSLVLAALILYYSDFIDARKHVRFDRRHDVLLGTVITYLIAFMASALILWFFGRFDGHMPSTCLAQTVVLGIAATLGASAGRLLLQ